MARRALLVGINHYDNLGAGAQLNGCVNDAQRVASLLQNHADGTPNFHCSVLTSEEAPVTRKRLRQEIGELFRGTNDDALFYFSGHGAVTDQGGYLVTQDAEEYDEGISMDDLLKWANAASEREISIILDCCRSGHVGNPGLLQTGGPYQQSLLRENVTVLAASLHSENSYEVNGGGIFTSLLVDALDGAAADIVGNVTLPGVYAHIEAALGPWEQRPIYKTHITSVSVLRRDEPRIERALLRRLPEFFEHPECTYQMSPDYEYNKVRTTERHEICWSFKQYRDAGLLTPSEPGVDLYWVATENGTVQLTRLGRHFWRLATTQMV